MQRKIFQMYGVNKLKSEIFEKIEIKDSEHHKKMLRREAKRASGVLPKISIGLKIGLLEVLERDIKQGYFGPLSRSEWRVRCLCGCEKEWVETYKRLYRGTAYSCGKVKRPRKQPESTRPPNQMSGRTIGRLEVGEYFTNRGWACVCRECGEVELVRYSKHLERVGRQPCLNF